MVGIRDDNENKGARNNPYFKLAIQVVEYHGIVDDWGKLLTQLKLINTNPYLACLELAKYFTVAVKMGNVTVNECQKFIKLTNKWCYDNNAFIPEDFLELTNVGAVNNNKYCENDNKGIPFVLTEIDENMSGNDAFNLARITLFRLGMHLQPEKSQQKQYDSAVKALNDVYLSGAEHYGLDNWKFPKLNGNWYDSCCASARGHALKHLAGEETDKDSGCYHLACLIWNLITYQWHRVNVIEGLQ